jgi:transcriptional regulator with XRE-family HTH domain
MKDKQITFAERVKQLRKENGLTQQQLADFIGISTSAVGLWESGIREVPKGDNLLKLAEAFGLDPVEVMRSSRKLGHGSPEEVQLLAAFRVLPKEQQLIAIKLLEALK